MRDDPFKDKMTTHRRRYYQETENSNNTISEKDFRDLIIINRRENVQVLTEVSRRSNCVEII